METLIVYHRGGGKSLGYPPNCIITIKWALTNKAKAIEYDVVVAKDNNEWKIIIIEPKLIVEHKLDINNLNWKDVSKINTGNEKYGKANVVTLKEVLNIVGRSNVMQQIHIKGNNPNTIPTLMSELKNCKNFLITSFDLNVLKQVKKIDSIAKVGWIVKPDSKSGSEEAIDLTKIVTSDPYKFPEHTNQELLEIKNNANLNNIDVVILCAPKIRNKDTIVFFQNNGVEIGGWGVGANLELAKKLINFGINRFTIDNPEELD